MKRNSRSKEIRKATIIFAAFLMIGAIAPTIAFADEIEVVETATTQPPIIVVTPYQDAVTQTPEIVFTPVSESHENKEMAITVEVLLNEGKPIVINKIPNNCFVD